MAMAMAAAAVVAGPSTSARRRFPSRALLLRPPLPRSPPPRELHRCGVCASTIARLGRVLLVWLAAVRLCGELPCAAASFGELSFSWQGSGAGSSAAPLKLAAPITLDLFGRTAHWAEGLELWRGYRLFFDMYHAKYGGVLLGGVRVPVELLLIDDESDEDLVENITRHIIDTKGIRLLLSPYGDALALRAAQVAGARALLVSPTAASSVNMVGRHHFFSMTPSSSRTFQSALQALADAGVRTVSVLHEDAPDMAHHCSVKYAVRNYGLSLMATRVVPSSPSRADLEGAVQLLKDDNSDALFVCVVQETCHEVTDLIREAKWDVKAVVFTGCVTETGFPSVAGSGSLGVSVFAKNFNARSALGGWHAADVVEAYKSNYATEDLPAENTVKAFLACEALVGAIEAVDSTDPSLVAGALRTMDVTSITGRIAFDGNNQLDMDYLVVQAGTEEDHIVAPPAVARSAMLYPRTTWLDVRCLSTEPESDSYGFTVGNDGTLGSCRLCDADMVSQLVPISRNFSAGKHRVCTECSEGMFVDKTIGGDQAHCSECAVGRFWTRGGSEGQDSGARCQLCPEGTFQDKYGQTQCTLCPLGTYSSSADGATFCVPCSIKDGLQSFADKYGQMFCWPCPENAICSNKSITNEAGYAILTKENPPGSGLIEHDTVHCVHERGKACLSNGRCHIDEITGEPSNDGPMCGSCRPGYGRIGRRRICRVCDEGWTPWLFALQDAAIAFCSMGFVCLIVLNTDFSTLKSISPVVLKLVYSYMYFLTALWPTVPYTIFAYDVVERIMAWISSLSGAFGTYHGHWARQCLWQRIFPNIEAYKISVMSGMIPLPTIIAFTIIGFLFLRFTQRKRAVEVTPWTRCLNVCMVYVYILQPQCAILLLDTVSCVHFDKSRLAMDTKVACFEGDHVSWGALALVGLIFYTVGVPLCVGLELRRQQRRNRLRNPEVQHALGFLYNGYAPSAYNYECICMFRKAAIHILSVAPGLTTWEPFRYQSIQTLCMLGGFSLFIVLHYLSDPYDKRAYFILDKIEIASLTAAQSTSLLQTWGFLTGNLWSPLQSKVRKVVIAVFVLTIHARFWRLAIWACVRTCLTGPSTLEKRGFVEIHQDGYVLLDLDASAALLFEDMFGLITAAHMEEGCQISYEGLVAAMQRIAVHAGYLKALRAKRGSNVAEKVEVLCRWIELLPLSDDQKEKGKTRLREVMMAFVHRAYALSSLVTVQAEQDKAEVANSGRRGAAPQREAQQNGGGRCQPRFGTGDADDYRRFTHEALVKSVGRRYTVEELYLAMLSLDKEICDLASPPVPSSRREQRFTWKGNMITGELDTGKVLRSELRAEMRQHWALTNQLDAARLGLAERKKGDGYGSTGADSAQADATLREEPQKGKELPEYNLGDEHMYRAQLNEREAHLQHEDMDVDEEDLFVLTKDVSEQDKRTHLSVADALYWGSAAMQLDHNMPGNHTEVPSNEYLGGTLSNTRRLSWAQDAAVVGPKAPAHEDADDEGEEVPPRRQANRSSSSSSYWAPTPVTPNPPRGLEDDEEYDIAVAVGSDCSPLQRRGSPGIGHVVTMGSGMPTPSDGSPASAEVLARHRSAQVEGAPAAAAAAPSAASSSAAAAAPVALDPAPPWADSPAPLVGGYHTSDQESLRVFSLACEPARHMLIGPTLGTGNPRVPASNLMQLAIRPASRLNPEVMADFEQEHLEQEHTRECL